METGIAITTLRYSTLPYTTLHSSTVVLCFELCCMCCVVMWCVVLWCCVVLCCVVLCSVAVWSIVSYWFYSIAVYRAVLCTIEYSDGSSRPVTTYCRLIPLDNRDVASHLESVTDHKCAHAWPWLPHRHSIHRFVACYFYLFSDICN